MNDEEETTYPLPQPIDLSSLAHPRSCINCDSLQDVRRYNIRTGATSRNTVAWCHLCAKKVALFLFQATLEDDNEEESDEEIGIPWDPEDLAKIQVEEQMAEEAYYSRYGNEQDE